MFAGCFPSCFGIKTSLQITKVHNGESSGTRLACWGGCKAALLPQHLDRQSRGLAACPGPGGHAGAARGWKHAERDAVMRASEDCRGGQKSTYGVKRKSSNSFALLTLTWFGSLAVIMRTGSEAIWEDDGIYSPSQSLSLMLSASFLSSLKQPSLIFCRLEANTDSTGAVGSQHFWGLSILCALNLKTNI